MPAPANRRMPLSCEPCRERKIRCPRNAGASGGPCASCVRRGVPPHECVYLRDVYARLPPRPPLAAAEGREATNNELLERIRKLESLVGSNADRRRPTTAGETSAPISSPLAYSTPAQTPQRVVTTGRLSRSPSGHERYEPLSSKWSSLLATNPATESVNYDIDALETDAEFPFTAAKVQMDDILSALPAMSHCDQLRDTYFSVFAPLFHILHDPTFLADYARFRSQPDHMPLSWLALLFSVLGVAVTALDERTDLLRDIGKGASASKDISLLTSRYRAAAFRCLEADHYLWRHNIYTLQALILLVYGINHSHGQSWALLGLTRNIALALGCHVDPEHFDLSVVQAEQRRRCWAALTMLYMIQNTSLGSIDSAPIQSTVKLPLDVDDDQLTAGAATPLTRSSAPSQMSYLLHKFRLYDLCSRICGQLFSHMGPPDYDDISALDEEIASQQEEWNQIYLNDTRHAGLPDHHAVHLNILFGYSHQLLLLLHRPVLIHGRAENSDVASYMPSQVFQSRDRCLGSASALLGIHRLLWQNNAFRPYQWYNRGLGSFHAFHAAVFIAYVCVTSSDISADRSASLRRELEVSVNTFEAIAATGMSRICEKASLVLRHLCASASLSAQGRFSDMPDSPVPGPLTPALSSGTEDQPLSLLHTNPQQLEIFLETLRPEQWLSPSAVAWNDWDLLVDGCSN